MADSVQLDGPIVVHVERGDWYGVWQGGEYINVYPDEENARLEADGGNPQTSVHSINTTGDTIGDDPEEYVRKEVQEWADEDGGEYRANGWGA
ncbi:hypothetical protein ABZX93_05960 [Streptomyces sp. NPDC006632]|uniref:hypothetical protein n=1 Tax=Streptomyces sp. NPDC006632 TaxID=3157182 RepID=UPI0033AAE340